jgi:hypothetical protein
LKNPSAEDKVFVILDLQNAYLSQTSLVVEYFLIMLKNYPESLHKIVMINTPMLFTAVWAVIRQFLDERSLSKVEIFGYQYHERLHEMVELGNLPERYGGYCKCEGGCDKKDLGPWNENGEDIEPLWDFEGRDLSEQDSRPAIELAI